RQIVTFVGAAPAWTEAGHTAQAMARLTDAQTARINPSTGRPGRYRFRVRVSDGDDLYIAYDTPEEYRGLRDFSQTYVWNAALGVFTDRYPHAGVAG
ncbi:hypothetical protein CXG81DRAFT_27395, partial [Caulochytrium protostelioides]